MIERKGRFRLISALLAMMALLSGCCMTAYAASEGSISVTLSYANEEGHAQDGAMTLYHVADIAYDGNGKEMYTYTDAFAGCAVSLEAVSDDTNHDLAAALIEYVYSSGAESGSVYSVNPEDGVVSISGLQTGLYLLVQDTETTDAYTFDPFLVSIPCNGIYDVDASPKVEVMAYETPVLTVTPTGTPVATVLPTGTPVPTNPSTPGSPGRSTTPVTPSSANSIASTLPQTGQLFWPIPLLAGGGSVILLIGYLLRRPGRGKGTPAGRSAGRRG